MALADCGEYTDRTPRSFGPCRCSTAFAVAGGTEARTAVRTLSRRIVGYFVDVNLVKATITSVVFRVIDNCARRSGDRPLQQSGRPAVFQNNAQEEVAKSDGRSGRYCEHGHIDHNHFNHCYYSSSYFLTSVER